MESETEACRVDCAPYIKFDLGVAASDGRHIAATLLTRRDERCHLGEHTTYTGVGKAKAGRISPGLRIWCRWDSGGLVVHVIHAAGHGGHGAGGVRDVRDEGL